MSIKGLISKLPRKSGYGRSNGQVNYDSALFVHIPKTAGTSFRRGLEASYELIKDYGAESPETSEIVLQHIYRQPDRYLFRQKYKQGTAFWLAGHFHLSTYLELFDAARVVSFIRDPVSRVISHYNHHRRYHNLNCTFDQFIESKGFINLQSRFLSPLPVGLIGYLGITEHYNESLDLINQGLGLSIEGRVENVNDQSEMTSSSITEEQCHKIIEFNATDIALYKQALLNHQQRVALTAQAKPWVYSEIVIHPNGVLNGCAYWQDSSRVVELSVFKNNDLLTELDAKEFYHGYVKAGFPRDRYVGFHLPLQGKVKKGDYIEVRVKDTQQLLTLEPIIVSH